MKLLPFLLGAVTLIGCSQAVPERTTEPSHTPPTVAPLVLAHYYPWYGTPDGPSGRWSHWDPDASHHGSTNTPALGLYDSRSPAVLRQHIRWARQAGLDGFIASWWGSASFEEGSLAVLLQVAEEASFPITVMVEQADSGADLRAQLQHLLSSHAQNPAWLRAGDRPVVFIYSRVASNLSTGALEQALDGLGLFAIADGVTFSEAKRAFDGILFYNPLPDVAGYERVLPEVIEEHRAAGRIVVAAAVPGYNDTNIRQPGLRVPRGGGALYRRMWNAARPADWVAVTSWNEWHEGTEIEPSDEHGDRYLTLTDSLQAVWQRGR